MKLGIKDRLSIIQMLPQTGGLTEMVDILDIVKKVRLEKEEMDRVQYIESNGRIAWNPELEEELDIDFTFEQKVILRDCVKKLDTEKKITASNLDVCIKINNL